MKTPIENNVKVAKEAWFSGGSVGKIYCTEDEIREVFGEPLWEGNIDDKVHIMWALDTPRGSVQIRDYWWNKKGPDGSFIEWTIEANTAPGNPNRKVIRNAVRWAKFYGTRTNRFTHYGKGYCLDQFMSVPATAPEWMQEFDGYHHDSPFSGVLIKISPDGDGIKAFTFIG